MCGFAGVLNSKTAISKPRLKEFAKEVSFRGPDSCGVRLLDERFNVADDGRHAFFFNRLAIIDLDSRSDQPFEDERFLLIFNGEIYNYEPLKASLQKKGVRFRTTSDTEVLFCLLREYGIAAISQLNGMFSFFWLDKQDRTFIIARDRLGIKPMYYATQGGSLSFASELNSVLRLLVHQPQVNKLAVEMFLWMQFVPTPHSIINGILKLPPGHYLKGSVDNISANDVPCEYWNAYDNISPATSEASDLESILNGSLERQMVADVPLGFFLSSGIDSSLLAALINKHHTKDREVNFFTVAFDEPTASNESEDALAFIKGFGNPCLKTHVLPLSAASLQERFTRMYDFVDEPFGDSACLLNWAISEKARAHVTVALSGDGADELFWGYPRYDKWQKINKLNTFPLLSKIIVEASRMAPSFEMRNTFQRAFSNNPVKTHFDLFSMPAFRQIQRVPITSRSLWAMEGVDKIKFRKDAAALLDIKTYLSDAMLYKVDRASMAASLEVRVPYLDNEMVDFALKLDLNQKSNTLFRNKAPLKTLLMKLAPHYDINRKKKGFNFPKKMWLRTHWKDQVLECITPTALSDLGLDPKPLMNVVKSFYENSSNADVEVWYLLNLCLWKQRFDKMIGQRAGTTL